MAFPPQTTDAVPLFSFPVRFHGDDATIEVYQLAEGEKTPVEVEAYRAIGGHAYMIVRFSEAQSSDKRGS